MLSSSTLAVLTVAALLSWYVFNTITSSKRLPLPPGPPKLPLIGNLLQAPKEWPWRTYHQWSKTYGPIMHVKYGGDNIILLSTHKAATDLMEKRGNIYSDRPRFVQGQENHSKGERTLLLPYNAKYRRHQKVHGSLLSSRMSNHYTAIQDLESKQLMFELLSTNGYQWMDSIHRYSSSLTFSLAFGKRMPRGDEQEIQDIGLTMERFLQSAKPGTWIVDAIPVLNRLPKFLAPWKRLADEYYAFESAFYRDNMDYGKSTPYWNWATQALQMKEAREMTQRELSYVINQLYEAGSDTTTMALQSFVLAAALHPEVMEEAQHQIDSTLDGSFPTFADRERLPLVHAIAKEVLRWRPVSAGGIPHAVMQEDEYMGFRIPAGSTVLGNHWAINMDESFYGPDAQAFRPQRFIDDPSLPYASFGWGRRACTGQHVAMNSLFINIARMLWLYDIRHATEDGKRVEIDPLAYTLGFNSGPSPFKVQFVVRSVEKHEFMVREWNAADKDIGSLLDNIQKGTSRA